MTGFTYQEFTTRNLGFVSAEEQTRLRNASVFVCGTGGMGGSAIMTLIRAGVGRLILADLDAFEVSNLNRQLLQAHWQFRLDRYFLSNWPQPLESYLRWLVALNPYSFYLHRRTSFPSQTLILQD